MEFRREKFLKKLIDSRHNGMVKIIAGVRGCGKTYLLFNLYKNYLLSDGVKEDHIFEMAFDDPKNEKYLDEKVFYHFLLDYLSKTDGMRYIFLDEVQLMFGFEIVLNSLLYKENVDIYVTGSTAKYLVKDVITEFRGRGWTIPLYPLSFSEFMEAYSGSPYDGFREYVLYGGMPGAALLDDEDKKKTYLEGLFSFVYVGDILSRFKLQRKDELEGILDCAASSVGSLVNADRLADKLRKCVDGPANIKTVGKYIDCVSDAYIVQKVDRRCIRWQRNEHTPYKLYYTDVGLRNARLHFGLKNCRDCVPILENLVYNELKSLGYDIHVGYTKLNGKKDGKSVRTELETDFVCEKWMERFYVQCAFFVDEDDWDDMVTRPLMHIKDCFKKVVVKEGHFMPWHNRKGLFMVSITDFLMHPECINRG